MAASDAGVVGRAPGGDAGPERGVAAERERDDEQHHQIALQRRDMDHARHAPQPLDDRRQASVEQMLGVGRRDAGDRFGHRRISPEDQDRDRDRAHAHQ